MAFYGRPQHQRSDIRMNQLRTSRSRALPEAQKHGEADRVHRDGGAVQSCREERMHLGSTLRRQGRRNHSSLGPAAISKLTTLMQETVKINLTSERLEGAFNNLNYRQTCQAMELMWHYYSHLDPIGCRPEVCTFQGSDKYIK